MNRLSFIDVIDDRGCLLQRFGPSPTAAAERLVFDLGPSVRDGQKMIVRPHDGVAHPHPRGCAGCAERLCWRCGNRCRALELQVYKGHCAMCHSAVEREDDALRKMEEEHRNRARGCKK